VSTYPTAPAQGRTTAGVAPEKPGTLKAAVGIAVVTALAAVANGALTLVGGKDLAKELAQKAADSIGGLPDIGLGAGVNDKILDVAATEALSSIQTRAYITIVFGALLLLFGLLMGKAGTGPRVMVTISAVMAMGISFIIILDIGTTLMLALGWVTVIGAVVTIVVTWLGPNGRYAKARKQA
jgi:hypothetical protein